MSNHLKPVLYEQYINDIFGINDVINFTNNVIDEMVKEDTVILPNFGNDKGYLSFRFNYTEVEITCKDAYIDIKIEISRPDYRISFEMDVLNIQYYKYTKDKNVFKTHINHCGKLADCLKNIIDVIQTQFKAKIKS